MYLIKLFKLNTRGNGLKLLNLQRVFNIKASTKALINLFISTSPESNYEVRYRARASQLVDEVSWP